MKALRLISTLRSHPWRTALIGLAIAFLALNVSAYYHARSMLNYQAQGDRTPSPEALSTTGKVEALLFGVSIPRPENHRSPADVGLVGETVRFRAADGALLEAWLVRATSTRGIVLLCHGFPASRSSLLNEAREFHDLGWSTLLLDFRGCGGSDGHTTTLGYREAKDVAAAVRFVRAQLPAGPIVIYGQSMGAAATLRSIAACDVRPDAVIIESVFGRLVDSVRNRFALMGVPSFPGAELLVFWGGVQAGFSGFTHDPVEYARSCNCPALLLHGEADRSARPEEGRAVFDNLRGSKSLEMFPGAPHVALHGVDAARWRRAVTKFLAQIEAE